MSIWGKRGRPADRGTTCTQAARALQAYLDGETDEATARRVAAHLEDCHRCGPDAETYRRIKDALARRPEPDLDAVERLRGFAGGLLRSDADGQHKRRTGV
ncbi:zf-HC2 domain-containing protein [Streptomyces sp. H51]|uniref:anti-sigma factor family protein n=1 Tax=Streptomyces sp. H51 TaxID=3111770 RepID=UPI002D76DF00|nr:zf-HC2 domain-containing protein [Streptomyces sp. H51]